MKEVKVSLLRLCALLAALGLAALPPGGPTRSPVAEAAVPFKDIASAGPLTHIYLGNELSCQIAHVTDGSVLELYPPGTIPGDCGTFVVVNNTLYAPNFANHGGTATSGLGTYTAFTPVSQSAVLGTGTAGDPFRVVTVVDVGTTGLRLTQTDSYVVGQESYRTDVQVQNSSPSQQIIILYRAGDCFLGASDFGYGLFDPTTKTAGCAKNANNNPPGRIEQWTPITPAHHGREDFYSTIWSNIGAHTDFNDTCPCTTYLDNGAGINWDLTIPASSQMTASHLTTFSPTGVLPLTTAKVADASTSPPAGTNGYTITISNPNATAVTLNSIIDTLPAGFSYVSGSTTGVTTANPSISAQTLTWSGPFSVGGTSSVSLHFNVTVASTAGTYFNNATGDAGSVAVTPTGDTAPITVELIAITVSPLSDTNFIGEQHTVTATISPASAGVLVTFTVSGANPGAPGVCTPNADCTTNASGQVSFTYTGFKLGDDTITASATVLGQPVSDNATKTWGFPGAGFISPVAGGQVGDYLPPVDAALAAPARLVRDGDGRIYAADTEHHRIRRIDPGADGVVNGSPDEVITTVAGTGTAGYVGDGGPAVDAKLSSPQGLALDSTGDLYIADTGNHVIRKVDTSGKITTIAGTGVAGHTGDGPGTATAMKLDEPRGLAFDGAGNLLIADTCNHRIRRLDGPSLATMRTVAGGGPAGCGAGDFIDNQQPATSARLNRPTDVAVGTGGVYFIADSCNQRVRKVDATDTMTTVAGSGAVGCGSGGFGGDGGAATSALLNQPSGVAVTGAGDLYIADTDNCRLRKVSGGTISTAAGTGTCGYGGDGGPAADAQLSQAEGVIVDAAGNVHIADTQNHRLRFIDVTNGFISTVGGTGGPKFCGDTGVAVASSCVNAPEGLGVNAAGDLYIADAQNHRVRYVNVTDGHIYTVAGKGEAGFCGDSGAATAACLNTPADVAVASDGKLYISDQANHRIRVVAPGDDGVVNGGAGETITTVAGDGTAGFNGDGAPATSFRLNNPTGLALDTSGNLYIADRDNCRVRELVPSTGTISTVAGTVTCGYDGEGPATSRQLNHVRDVVMRGASDFYIADTDNCRVRLVSGGTISTVAGTGTCGFAGDFGLANDAQLQSPAGLALGSTGELVISDQGNHRLRTVLAGSDGIVNGGSDEYIVTSAGGATPTPGFCGDPDPNPTPPPEVIVHLATDACLNTPAGLARAGDQLYFSDQANDRVRKIPADCDLDGLLNSQETGLPDDTEACIADTDVDGHKDPQSTSQAGVNPDPNQDNCPLNYNPGQQNLDGAIDNGPDIPGDDVTAPDSDSLGDACDPDRDNDWMLDTGSHPTLGTPGEDVGCGSGPTNPLKSDTDGDTVVDGAECLLGSDPNDPASKPPAQPPGDGDNDGLPAAVEALFGSSDSNPDTDGDGIPDGTEVKGWASSPSSQDTDGDSGGDDGCRDDKEIASVNTDKQANILDVVLVARMAFGLLPPHPALDINKDGAQNVLDVVVAARNSNLLEPHPQCQ